MTKFEEKIINFCPNKENPLQHSSSLTSMAYVAPQLGPKDWEPSTILWLSHWKQMNLNVFLLTMEIGNIRGIHSRLHSILVCSEVYNVASLRSFLSKVSLTLVKSQSWKFWANHEAFCWNHLQVGSQFEWKNLVGKSFIGRTIHCGDYHTYFTKILIWTSPITSLQESSTFNPQIPVVFSRIVTPPAVPILLLIGP